MGEMQTAALIVGMAVIFTAALVLLLALCKVASDTKAEIDAKWEERAIMMRKRAKETKERDQRK